ncbi:MAG: glycosyl transferase [Chloroflexi bacterium HGW-Chloroflexi-6]|nr:MAG: glycosyl transferase [Chloroflexi bacterium HGW-Chloroflexi-6]
MKQITRLGNGSIALLLACLTIILLTVTAPAIGLTWDEPAYIAGANSVAGWFEALAENPGQAFGPEIIQKYWSVTHEHPPVDKIVSGLVWLAARNFFDELTANRLGNMLLVALLVALLYLMLAQVYGKAAGLFAVAALIAMPRFFFHAHLAALDVPVAVGTFVVTFLFWKTIDRNEWWWGLLLGVAWGLVVATKLNGVFVPIAFVIWLLVFRRKGSLALRLVLMGLTAILTFFVIWPWLYYQTWDRVVEYVGFHVFHYDIGQWYFGQFYLPPPWHFVLVILWAVVPLTTLLLALAGMARAGKGQRDNGLAWLLTISAFVSILPFLFGKSLLYDNDRLFMPVYPFLAALAGVGFAWAQGKARKLAEQVRRPGLALPISLLLAILALTPQSLAMVRQYPHLLSYYSESVGGLSGATKLGLETTYWCETYASALPYINAHASPGDKIWIEPWSYDVLLYYQRIGMLREDVLILNPYLAFSILGLDGPQPVIGRFGNADWYIFQYRQTQYNWDGEQYPPLQTLESNSPVYEVIQDGIPLMRLYGKLK